MYKILTGRIIAIVAVLIMACCMLTACEIDTTQKNPSAGTILEAIGSKPDAETAPQVDVETSVPEVTPSTPAKKEPSVTVPIETEPCIDSSTSTTAPSEPEHTHNYKVQDIAPSCTEQGYVAYLCDCGAKYESDYIPANGHSFGEWHTSINPACTANGERYRECSVCNYEEYQTVLATGHSYTTVITAPTCTQQGYTTYSCPCGDHYMADFKNAAGHSWSAWVVANEPQIGIEGAEQRICRFCSETETRKIDALPEPDYEVFTHEIGVYHIENKRYEMALKNHFDYAAYISVYATSREVAHENAIIKAFEEHFGFSPTAKVKIEETGIYLVEGQVQTVYQFSIFDTTYPFLEHEPYEVYHQICTDGVSHWVGFALIGSYSDDWSELMSDPQVQELRSEMLEMFYEVTGYDADYISEHRDDFCINWISVAGEMRTADGKIIEVLFIYCREKTK